MNAFVVVESANVDDAADRFVMNALVVVEFKKVDEVAVRSLIATFDVKFAGPLKSERPLNTASLSVGDVSERLSAEPPEILGVSTVVSLR